jgi:hypothetical protein
MNNKFYIFLLMNLFLLISHAALAKDSDSQCEFENVDVPGEGLLDSSAISKNTAFDRSLLVERLNMLLEESGNVCIDSASREQCEALLELLKQIDVPNLYQQSESRRTTSLFLLWFGALSFWSFTSTLVYYNCK